MNDQIEVIRYFVLEGGVELKSEHVVRVKAELREAMRSLLTEQAIAVSMTADTMPVFPSAKSCGFSPL